jgi:4-aminobutyrate aminotransferase
MNCWVNRAGLVELLKGTITKEKTIREAEWMMYECLKNGLSFKVSQGNVLQSCPPIIIKRNELKAAIAILEIGFQKIAITGN